MAGAYPEAKEATHPRKQIVILARRHELNIPNTDLSLVIFICSRITSIISV